MPAHVSVATAIEKNRIASPNAFVLLLEIIILDINLDYVETLRLAKNSEEVLYQGNVYNPANFNVKLNLDAQSAPKFQVDAQDPSGFIRDRMEDYGGGVGFDVLMTVVNTGNLDQPPEIQEKFTITEASSQGYLVSFTMGVENPVALRFPYRMQWRDQCPYRYKGPRCKYAGSLPSCDFTFFGANGCKAHDNDANYGGFLGLSNTATQ